jgi:hypothetical protein
MSTQTQAESYVLVTKRSVDVSIDNSISACASIGASANNETSIEVGASVKTGTISSAGAGLDGKNIYIGGSYSDTTECHVTVDASVGSHGVSTDASVDAYAKTGTELEGNMKVGANGAVVSAGASTGSYVGVDAEGTIKARGISATGGAGVTVGDHFEVGGSAEATYTNGKINLGVSGDVAALVGLEVDANVSIDTKQIQHDAITIANTTVKVEKIVESTVSHEAVKVEKKKWKIQLKK